MNIEKNNCFIFRNPLFLINQSQVIEPAVQDPIAAEKRQSNQVENLSLFLELQRRFMGKKNRRTFFRKTLLTSFVLR